MTICPHCKKELNQDRLEKVMDCFEPGNQKQTLSTNCEHCNNRLSILYEYPFYYLESINETEKDQMIGAK